MATATGGARAKLKRTLLLGVKLRPGEGAGIAAMFASLFLILFTAYLLKPAREMLILTEGTAEIRSYAVALQALLLLVFIPLYGFLSRRFHSDRFMHIVTLLCVFTLLAFAGLGGGLGVPVSVPFFVWLGAYSVMIIAQFWAFASDLYSREAGERLFVIVAFGASLGAWVGSAVSRQLVDHIDAYGLMICGAMTLLLATLPAGLARRSVPALSRGGHEPGEVQETSLLAGFRLVATRPYLLLMAAFVILLNLVNTTGEFLLASVIEMLYREASAAGEVSVDKGTYVGRFYSTFYLLVNFCGVLIQYCLVSRLLRYAGFAAALLLTPLIVFLGYSGLAVLPVLAWFRYFKVIDNSLDYSLQNTVRQMLYLPLTRQEKYEARAVIDPLGQRLGDLLQAGMIFAGLNLLGMNALDYVPVAAVLAGLNVVVVLAILWQRQRLLAPQPP